MASQYRPYLTAEEIEDLCKLLSAHKHEHTFTPALDKVYKKLYTLHLKVQSNLVTPGYTSSPLPSIEEKLGLQLKPPATPAAATHTTTTSPLVLRLEAYNKKQRGEVLSPEEVELAETYEWEQQEQENEL